MPWRVSMFNLFRIGGRVPRRWQSVAVFAGVLVFAAMLALTFSMVWKGTLDEWSFALIALFLVAALALVRSAGEDGGDDDKRDP